MSTFSFPFLKQDLGKFYIVNMLCYERGPCDYNFIAVIEKHVPQYLTCSVLSHVTIFAHAGSVSGRSATLSNEGSTFKSKMVLDILGRT